MYQVSDANTNSCLRNAYTGRNCSESLLDHRPKTRLFSFFRAFSAGSCKFDGISHAGSGHFHSTPLETRSTMTEVDMDWWVMQGEEPGKPDEVYRYAIVVDFEATCWEERVNTDVQEIIEFPAVIIDLAAPQGQPPVAEFQRYVRPTDRPELSEFCTELTGITQAMVSGQQPLAVVLAEFVAWIEQQTYLMSKGPECNFVLCADGDWDFGSIFPIEIKRKHISHLVPGYLKVGWCDVRKYFNQATGHRGGMKRMLEHLRLPLLGKHHSGIDDARNIARILQRVGAIWQNPVDINTSPARKTWK